MGRSWNGLRGVLVLLLIAGVQCGRDANVAIHPQERIVTPPPPPTEGLPDADTSDETKPGPRDFAKEKVKPFGRIDVIPGPDVVVRTPEDRLVSNFDFTKAKASFKIGGSLFTGPVKEFTFSGGDGKDCAWIKDGEKAGLLYIHFEKKNERAHLTPQTLKLNFFENEAADDHDFTEDGRTLFSTGDFSRIYAFSKLVVDIGGDRKDLVPRRGEYKTTDSREGLSDRAAKTRCTVTSKRTKSGTDKGWVEGTFKCNRVRHSAPRWYSLNNWIAIEGEFSCPLRTSPHYPVQETEEEFFL